MDEQKPKPIPTPPSVAKRVGRGVSIQDMMWVVVIVAFLFALIASFGWYSVPILIIAAIGLTTGLISVAIQRKRDEQESLLWLLSTAAEKQMPLSVGIEALADQWSGGARRRALAVSSLLKLGLRLPDALQRTDGAVSRSAEVLIGVGDATGMLKRSLLETHAYESDGSYRSLAIFDKLVYVVGMVGVMQSITFFILYFITPKFEAIFKDFGVDLPASTILMIKTGRYATQYFLVPLLFFGILAIVVYAIEKLLLRGTGTSLVTDRLLSQKHTTTILRALAIGVDGEKPIGEVLDVLAKRYPTFLIRKRLQVAAERVRRGGDWVEALRLSNLIRKSDAAVLNSAQRAGNLGWALKSLALWGEKRVMYRLQAFVELLWPISMILVSIFVFFSAIAYFTPLVTLIERLSG